MVIIRQIIVFFKLFLTVRVLAFPGIFVVRFPKVLGKILPGITIFRKILFKKILFRMIFL